MVVTFLRFAKIKKNRTNKKHLAPNDKDLNRTAILDDFLYVVDRLLIQGHVDPVCLSTCDPDNFPELSGKNTVNPHSIYHGLVFRLRSPDIIAYCPMSYS
jgi:hypothetical protein